MLLSDQARCRYGKSPLIEVICQLRFPEILSISAKDPAEFQEAVRGDYPRYQKKLEQQPPKVVNGKLEQQEPLTNYHFVSADGGWKINLTNRFVALSTVHYTSWEEFAARLDKVVAACIKIYQPSYFERIGLRYVNAFSRKLLELEGTPWNDLFNPAYLGVLDEEDVPEGAVAKCSVDVELALENNCRVKIHSGPGHLKRNNQEEPEVRFILDQDLFLGGQMTVEQTVGALNSLHENAFSLFRGAITKMMHEALEPQD